MLLVIDIGNTNIHNGVFQGEVLKRKFLVPTYSKNLKSEYIRKLALLKDVDSVIIVSVVPQILKKLEAILKNILHKRVLVVGRDIDSGVQNLYKKPDEVGQDRLVNARAAYDLYGESIIVDFGTAITIDCVNSKKEYLGGVIVPGVEISLNALSERAALLPKVSLKKPSVILGRETRESMIAGAVYGFSSLCDGLVGKIKRKYCRKAKVVATGGLSSLIGHYCESVDVLDPDLTLKGLANLVSDTSLTPF